MCACVRVLDCMKHIKCKKITNKLVKKKNIIEWKKERMENEADDNNERQQTSKTTNTIRDF